MSRVTFDVVVVGGGPAGSRTARDLARAGFHVCILEEHLQVGLPCHCSGLVTQRTLALADVGNDIVLNEIRGARVCHRNEKSFCLGDGRVYALVVDRPELDRRLSGQASAAGVETRVGTRYVSHRMDGEASRGGHVLTEVISDGEPSILRSRLLIGADGARSRTASVIRRGKAPSSSVSGLGALAIYETMDSQDHVEIFLDTAAAPGWFGWSIPVGNGMARLGTGSTNGVRPIESFRLLRQRFPESFGSARILSHSGGSIPLWEPGPMVADRLMLVGDAARQVKPTSGGGIYGALFAAAIAAEEAVRALRRSDLSSDGLRPYERRWQSTMGYELSRQRDLRRAFVRLTPADLDAILNVLLDSGARRTLAAVGDIDFPSSAAISFLRRKPMLALRLLAAIHSPGAWLRMARGRR